MRMARRYPYEFGAAMATNGGHLDCNAVSNIASTGFYMFKQNIAIAGQVVASSAPPHLRTTTQRTQAWRQYDRIRRNTENISTDSWVLCVVMCMDGSNGSCFSGSSVDAAGVG